jgi:hypothetical protein
MRHEDIAKNFLRLSHFNGHGLRKSSGSHASSAQPCHHHLYPLPHVVNGPSEKFLMYIFVLPWAATNIWVGSWLFLIQAKRRSACYHRTGKINHTRLSFRV